jgi:hypothetical protein
MPYIKQDDRRVIDIVLDVPVMSNAGELNYVLTKVVKDYLEQFGISYQTMNDIVGALDGAKVEFQRRIVAPYEDKKIKQNGDVY